MDEVFDFLFSLRSYYIYVTFIITTPSFLLYLSEVVVIIKYKQLHNSFNILFAVRAIANWLKMVGSVFGYRLPRIIGGFILPFYQILPSQILALYTFFNFFCFYVDNFSTTAIQLNRFIAIAFPLHYEMIWLYLLPFSVLIIYGLPLYFSFCFILRDTQISVVKNDPLNFNSTTFSVNGVKNQCSLDNSYLVRLFSIICLILCTVLSLSTIFLYHYRKRHRILNLNNNSNSNTSDKIERNLLIYAMCTFAGLGIITMFFHSTNLNLGGIFPDLRLSLDGITHDSCNIILPSWLMLWANSTFRQQWMADVLPKRWNLWKNETKIKTVDIRCRPMPTQTNRNRQTIPLSHQKRIFSQNRITVA